MKQITNAPKSIRVMIFSISADLILRVSLIRLIARMQEYSQMAPIMLVCTPEIHTSI